MESEHYTTHFQDEKNHLKEEGKIRSLSGETGLAVDRWGVECVRPWIQSPARKEGREKERGDERGAEKEDGRFRSYFEEHCIAPNLLTR